MVGKRHEIESGAAAGQRGLAGDHGAGVKGDGALGVASVGRHGSDRRGVGHNLLDRPMVVRAGSKVLVAAGPRSGWLLAASTRKEAGR